MDKNFRTVLVWWMAIMICLLFLRFAVQMDRMRKNKEVIEKWSERSERAKQISELEKDLEKQREDFRKKFGEEPTF